MTYNFCTLFDKNYIFRGLAMYQSLRKHCDNFKMWILCMDDIVYDQLSKMNLEFVTPLKLADLEDSELLKVKSGRTVAEYCWTLSSSLPLYVFKNNPGLESLAYLDSDLFFYSSPAPIFDELGDGSIYIVRHNYSKELAYLEARSGIYNVSLVLVKNDKNGLECLKWWRERCLEWCFSRLEDGKFGDQMYLNDWPKRFSGVKITKNKGINLAPWNMNKYAVRKIDDKIYVDEDELVFYHFHSFKMFGPNDYLPYQNFYIIRPAEEQVIYQPYKDEITRLAAEFKQKYPEYKYGFDKNMSWKTWMKYMLKKKLFVFFYLKSLIQQ